MVQIYSGLKSNLDVSWYAKPEYSWEQMREMRHGLKDKLNIKFYANPEFYWTKMERRRKVLKNVDKIKKVILFRSRKK